MLLANYSLRKRESDKSVTGKFLSAKHRKLQSCYWQIIQCKRECRVLLVSAPSMTKFAGPFFVIESSKCHKFFFPHLRHLHPSFFFSTFHFTVSLFPAIIHLCTYFTYLLVPFENQLVRPKSKSPTANSPKRLLSTYCRFEMIASPEYGVNSREM